MLSFNLADYCDFCEKYMPDTIKSRKKHMASAKHQQLRKSHYDRFKGPAEKAQEQLGKPPCHTFMKFGYCRNNLNCVYSHFPAGEDPEEYIRKLERQRDEATATSIETARRFRALKPPPGLKNIESLPPSLRPPPPEGYDFLSKEQWGGLPSIRELIGNASQDFSGS
ncbi:Zinc finger matrin-type protein 5 [Phlyctochytrium planicorne]|nr:Zinc finger matrin-type protein 5 [Phlyctochytrium planicorne]